MGTAEGSSHGGYRGRGQGRRRDHAQPRGKNENLDIIADIRRFFELSLSIAARAGIPKQHTTLDVGIGFAKTSRQNRDAILRLRDLSDYGLPIMVEASRKRFLGSLTGDGVEGTLVGSLTASLSAIT